MPAMRVDAKKRRESTFQNTLSGASLTGLMRSGSAKAYTTTTTTTNTTGDGADYNDDDDDDDCVLDPSLREMNYYLMLVFHTDADSRPCSPVVQVVHLAQQMPLPVVGGGDSVRRGEEILINCQLCGSSVRNASTLRVEAARVTAVYALGMTDLEANIMIHNVHDINLKISKHDICVSQRSNLALLPRAWHTSVPIGLKTLEHLQLCVEVTDVQLGILLLRESLSKSRAINVQLQRLHPFLATPSNLREAVETFTRKVSVSGFLRGQFNFLSG